MFKIHSYGDEAMIGELGVPCSYSSELTGGT
jgi:hypothetical protein